MCSPHAPVAQLDRASDYESEGRTFESFRARHLFPEASQAQKALSVQRREAFAFPWLSRFFRGFSVSPRRAPGGSSNKPITRFSIWNVIRARRVPLKRKPHGSWRQGSPSPLCAQSGRCGELRQPLKVGVQQAGVVVCASALGPSVDRKVWRSSLAWRTKQAVAGREAKYSISSAARRLPSSSPSGASTPPPSRRTTQWPPPTSPAFTPGRMNSGSGARAAGQEARVPARPFSSGVKISA